MSDIKLCDIHGDPVEQVHGKFVAVEKSLQDTVEPYLDTFLAVHFLALVYRPYFSMCGQTC
jgi:hypothetical protein